MREEKRATERQCAVTREVLPKPDLVRFVVGPDKNVVPDIYEKLPGRGIWVKAQREVIAKAVKTNVFARATKQKLSCSAELPLQVEMLLYKQMIESLALARKAGAVISGFMKVKEALQSGLLMALVHADDASPDGIEKLTGNAGILAYHCVKRDDLCRVVDKDDAAHLGVLDHVAGINLVAKLRRFTGFVETTSL